MVHQPFNPHYGATVAAATVAGAVNVNVPAAAKNLLLVNVGSQLAFIRVKPSGVAADASAADMPLPAGGSRVITKDGGNPGSSDGQTVVSVFAAAAGSTVYVCPGEGWGGP